MRKIEIPLIIIIILLAIAGFLLYQSLGNYVIIRFNELGPLNKNMSAYYKGFKIGRIVSIKPDENFKHTLVKVSLSLDNIKLPRNTVAYVERFPNGELYLQFVYPQSPSLIMLKRGDILEGISPSSIEQFMLGQSISSMSDMVSIHVIRALEAADAANQEMKLFFRTTSEVIEQNNKGITESVNNTVRMTKNLAQMAENLNQTTKKLNDALDEKTIKDTAENIKVTTENVSRATADLDKTVKKLDDTMTQVNEAAQNINSITTGINQTLSKKFGGMRIMFGKPVQKNEVRNACK